MGNSENGKIKNENLQEESLESTLEKINELNEKINNSNDSKEKEALQKELDDSITLYEMLKQNKQNAQNEQFNKGLNLTNERNVQSSQSNTTSDYRQKSDNLRRKVFSQVNKENQKEFNNDKQKLADDIRSLREKCNSFIKNINATKQLKAYPEFTKKVVPIYEDYQKELDELSKNLNTNDYNKDMLTEDKNKLQTLKSAIEDYSLSVFLDINLIVRGEDSFIEIAANKLEVCNTIINHLKKDGGSNDKIATAYINCRNKFNAILNNYKKESLAKLTETEFSKLYDSLKDSLHMLDTLNNRYEIENSWLNNQKQIARQNNKVDSTPKRSTSLKYFALIQARNEIASKRTHLETEISNINNESEKKYINQQIKDLKEIESSFNKKINDVFKEKWTREDIDVLINCNNKLVERVLTNIDTIKTLFALKETVANRYEKYNKHKEQCAKLFSRYLSDRISDDIDEHIIKDLNSLDKDLDKKIKDISSCNQSKVLNIDDFNKSLEDLEKLKVSTATMGNIVDNLLKFKDELSATKKTCQSILDLVTEENDSIAIDTFKTLKSDLNTIEVDLMNNVNKMLDPDNGTKFSPEAISKILEQHKQALNTINNKEAIKVLDLKKDVNSLLSKIDYIIENNDSIKEDLDHPLHDVSDKLIDIQCTFNTLSRTDWICNYDKIKESFEEQKNSYYKIVHQIKPTISNIKERNSFEVYSNCQNSPESSELTKSDALCVNKRTDSHYGPALNSYANIKILQPSTSKSSSRNLNPSLG